MLQPIRSRFAEGFLNDCNDLAGRSYSSEAKHSVTSGHNGDSAGRVSEMPGVVHLRRPCESNPQQHHEPEERLLPALFFSFVGIRAEWVLLQVTR